MKRKNIGLVLLLVALVPFLATCAATARGRLAQTGSVILALDETVYKGCAESKAAGWRPLSEKFCRESAGAFQIASNSWTLALGLIERDEAAPIAPHIIAVLTYILQTVDMLQQVGVKIPNNVQVYVKAVRGGLQ